MATDARPQCPHCRRRYPTRGAASSCCATAPDAPLGWCAWCGKDCKTTFCCRSCATAYRNDMNEEQAALQAA